MFLRQLMTRQIHKLFILFLLTFSTAFAVNLNTIPQVAESEGFFTKVFRCSWHISCYTTPKLYKS
jgi:hypothetical protein